MSPERFDKPTVERYLREIEARRGAEKAEKDRAAQDEALDRLVRIRQTLIDGGRLPSVHCQCLECCRCVLELRPGLHWK